MAGLSIKQRRAAYCQSLERTLGELIQRFSEMPEVEQVILFGSYAAGRRDLYTDLDLVVVMNSEQDFVTRTARLYQQVHSDVDMDLLVYTPEEFERMGDTGFIRQVMETGRVIYEKKSS